MSSPPTLAEELAALTPDQRAWVERELTLRAKAGELAERLQLDATDVYHQLKQLQRSPAERLQRGLALGRARSRPKDRAVRHALEAALLAVEDGEEKK